MIRHKRPKYVQAYPDRHGKPRIYFNKPGQPKIALRGPIYSEAFWVDYRNAEAGVQEKSSDIGASRTIPGSISDLIVKYYHAPDFLSLSPTSQQVYRRQLDHFREKHGEKRVAKIERAHIKAIIGKMSERKSAANNLLKRLKVLMGFAIDIGMVKDNPTLCMKGFKVDSDGFHTWTEEEISQYEAKHPIGSKARLAMSLMLYTGQRRSDAVKMGWQQVHGDRIKVRQQKTGAFLEIPIHPNLKAILDRTPKENMTFLMTEQGRPFTGNGFGNWMRDRCDEAGIPDCSSHGLRKAMATRLAQAGCSHDQIKAITGHKTESQVGHYTKAADQKMLSGQAMERLIESKPGTKSANPSKSVSKNGG